MAFSLDEIDRYDRQTRLAGWGAAGQERLRAATVTVRGRGVAAELCARYLAAAGVGALALEAFADEARALNPFVQVQQAPAPPGEPPAPIVVHVQHEGGEARIEAETDRAAAGGMVAVEALKAILGAPFRSTVTLDLEAAAG